MGFNSGLKGLTIPKHRAQYLLVRNNALPHIRKLPYSRRLSHTIDIIISFLISSLMTLQNLFLKL